MAKQRIGILSGSFDPVHHLSLRKGLEMLDRNEADQLLVILSADPAAFADAEDRWKMLVAACAGDKRILPSRLMLDRSTDELSEGLMKKLRKKYPDAVFAVIPSEKEDRFSSEARSSLASAQMPDLLDIPVREYCRCKGLYGMPGRLDRIDPWMDRLFSALRPKRYAHSLSVAWTSVRLAAFHGADTLRAEQAGLLHDCAKHLPLPEMQRIAKEAALTDDQTILENPSLLHSIVGAWVAEHEYGMTDPEVLEAIAYHNTGCAGMSRLAMCVCLADSTEPLRTPYPLLEQVRELSGRSLERALLLSLEGTAAYVKSHGWFLHPRTEETISWLRTLPATQDEHI